MDPSASAAAGLRGLVALAQNFPHRQDEAFAVLRRVIVEIGEQGPREEILALIEVVIRRREAFSAAHSEGN